MIRSMTGFGSASDQVDGVHYAVELRSLNNRYFKCSIRLPDQLLALEAELEMQLRKRLARGSITLTVGMLQSDASAAHQINEAAILAYVDQLEKLRRRLPQALASHVPLDLVELLTLPGVVCPMDEASLLRQARATVSRLVDRACDKLIQMRQTEGQSLAADLERQRDTIRLRLVEIRDRAPEVIEEYHQRLKSRVEELLNRAQLSVDRADLLREVAVYAERSDISEEISRLGGHLDQMTDLIAQDEREPAGRTLEFLGQEMLREANTISSKSNDTVISRAVVEIKTAIDRIKEQTANVE